MSFSTRPLTTLFMLVSVDGKISTGSSDSSDFDKDLPKIKGVKEGLNQYYELEQQTDLYSMNTGRVMAKIGINKRKTRPNKIPVSFVIIDNKPHLNKNGIAYLTDWVKTLYIVTTNKKHPAFDSKASNLEIILYKNKIDFENLFKKLKSDYGIEKLTIQSGGTMNSELLRRKLIDRISIVVAPCLIGGKNTSTLVDGRSLVLANDLKNIRALKLKSCQALKNSYIHLEYEVVNK